LLAGLPLRSLADNARKKKKRKKKKKKRQMRTGKEVRRNGCGAKKNRQEGLVSTPGRERLAGLLVLKMVVRLLLCRNRVVRCWRRSADGDRSVGRGQKLLLLLLLLLQLQLQLLLLLLVLVLLLL